MDQVKVDAVTCPYCRSPIDRIMVFRTCDVKMPGTFVLPNWVKRYGLPFLALTGSIAGMLAAMLFSGRVFHAFFWGIGLSFAWLVVNFLMDD